ncbi:K02A2.6-like [Cordylochernes scorpioides]|uniref:RNA-directed DNA polymerase n=1 Tax=Cordylochernes scorpioides TaxID=51811 RepID=A0ABY6KKJ3_9ARAC|nr:K02A2.6-like [Cordylochernes scorpioides]
MGDRADDIFRTFKFEKEEEATKIDSVLKAFDSHFCVRKNIIYERAKFNSRIQEDREPVDEFITSLYKLADSCEFEGLHEQLIRDRIVVGVRDKALSERMQLDSELTLEKAVKMVRQQEAVRQQQVDLQRPSTSQKVNQVKFNSKKQSPKQQQQPSRKKEKSAKTRSRCPKCGGFTHREGQACRAEGQKCNLCSKTGHFANCCPDKQAKTAEVKAVSELDEEIGFLLEVSAAEDSSNLDDDEGECRRRWTAEIQVNGKQVKFKLDSQADVTCVPLCLFKKIMGQQRLVKSDINLRAAEFSELQTVGQDFVWDCSQERAFRKLKELLTTQPILAAYDVRKPTMVSSDASSYGLGAVLKQEGKNGIWRPVAYSSRTMTPTEKRYVQIEKEALAITWACERFQDFLLGKRFRIETDHKPLIPLFSTKELSSLTPRLQRFRMRMMRFGFEIVHIPGKELLDADALSRQPLLTTEGGEDERPTSAHINAVLSSITDKDEMFHLRKGVTVQYPADPSTPTFSGEELEYVEPAEQFVKDSTRFLIRCTKPDWKEFKKVAIATAIGFASMGFIGFFIKLVHIPIKHIRANNTIITDDLLREKAKKLGEQLDVPENFTYSSGWLQRFKGRFHISQRRLCGEGASISPAIIDEHLANLNSILANSGYDPTNIYKPDETGLFFQLIPDRTLAHKDENCRGVKRMKQRITVLLCCNSTGTDKRRMLIIGKSAKPRCFRNFSPHFYCTYTSNSKAWMTSSIFQEWLLQFNKQLTAPLRKLISNKSEWKFGGEENDCFEKLKNMVSNAPILTFLTQPSQSPFHLMQANMVLVQCSCKGGQAIEYASFSLNATQRKYAQIEKELLAIVFGCERFQYYIWGNDVIVETDHKPLLSIVKKPLEKLSPRLQRMVLRLMRFQISLKFTPGKNMFMKKIKRLQKETHGDHTMIQLIEYAKNGWPKYKTMVCDEAKPYWKFQDEIHVSDGIVYKGNCIMVPSTLRKEILQVVHSSHQGIAASKEKARSAFYWPGMITQVENEVEKCRTCQEYSRKNPEESRIAHEIPEFPWEKIAVDFMEVSGTSSILVVDYHSKFVEIRKLSSKRETETIMQLKTIFRTHGIPRTLVSDNGPPFNSTGFKNFAQKYEFKHQTSSPKYPRSNGQVERTIQTIKGLIIKAVKSGRDPNLALMEFNNTPKYDLPSPTQMLMGRSVRTLSTYTRQQLKPLFDTTKNYQKLRDHQQKYAGSPKRILRPLEVGDNIMLQERHRKWVPATVTAKHETPRSYMVKTPSGSEYRRNRSHLRPRKFSVEDSAPTSQSPSIPGSQAGTAMDDNIQDHGRPTSENRRAYDPRENVAKKGEESSTSPSVRTRSGRTVRKPLRYRD